MKIRPAGKPGVPVTPASGFANGGADTLQREVDFGQRLERRRERAVLEEVALSGQRVVEQPPRRAHRRAAVAAHVPHRGEPRRDVVLVGRIGASRHAGVARVDEAGRCGREHRRLLPGVERVQMILRLGERLVHLVADAVVQRDARDPEFVLPVERVDPRRAVQVRIAGRLPVLLSGNRAGNQRRRCRVYCVPPNVKSPFGRLMNDTLI